MTTELVTLTSENHIAVITFNRPQSMNALNREMIVTLNYLIAQVKKDPYIRILVLKGLGEAFMAGSDLHEVNKDMDIMLEECSYFAKQFNATTLAMREMDKIIITCVHGLVAAQGMSLMLSSDLVVASDCTRFSLGYCNIATSPTGGITSQLPRLVGEKKAMELLLLSEMFDARKAEALGLVNWVVPYDELSSFTDEIIERMTYGPTFAYTQTKLLVNVSAKNRLSTQLDLEADAFVKTVHSRDFKTAVSAFLSKRQPEFEGR